jgi:CheY-like chemotaxis protein
MTILVLEDSGYVSTQLERALKGKGHEVLRADSVSDAQHHWEQSANMIDAIVIDLNMSAENLSPEQIARTKEYLLTGWIWFHDVVLAAKPEMRRRTIVYSDYLEEFYKNVPTADREGIKTLPKKGSSSSAKEIMEWLREIGKR